MLAAKSIVWSMKRFWQGATRLIRRGPVSAEDVAARAEAARIREEMKTQRAGSRSSAQSYTHGGKDSRGR
jgi:hypothetical protein